MSETPKSSIPVWLVVSLIVNALLIGLLIGGGLGQRKAGPNPINAGGVGAEQALIRGIDQSLPADERRTVRRAFRKAFNGSRAERLRVRDARQNLERLLAAEAYDAEAVQQSFAELREADSAMRAQMQDLLATHFGSLSLEQRRAILKDLNRRDGRRGAGPGDRRGPPPRPRD